MSSEPARRPAGAARSYGPGTLAVHAGLPDPVTGAPIAPNPVLAAPYHLSGDVDGAPYGGYARYGNPTMDQLEAAIGSLEGGAALTFASGMAATTAAVLPLVGPGDVVVVVADGYPGIRNIAAQRLPPMQVEVRLVPTDTDQLIAACDGAALVWIETPVNPRLDVCDIRRVAEAAHAAGARLVVDNTLATPLGQTPLALGADLVVAAATKALAGHSDVLLGYTATADEALHTAIRTWRDQTGAIPGPFEAWLVHRSLATLDLRLERSSTNALAIADALGGRGDVASVHHPSSDPVARAQMRRFGPLVCFDLVDGPRAERFLAQARLITEATSFGGVHTTAERRARWGTDAVSDGFIRLSAGIEDTEDLVADVLAALDASS